MDGSKKCEIVILNHNYQKGLMGKCVMFSQINPNDTLYTVHTTGLEPDYWY